MTLNGSGTADVTGTYYIGGVKTIYFDATMSKLPYSDVSGDRSIPSKSGVIKYYATKENGTSPIKGNMTKVPAITKGEHKYTNVYRVMVPVAYTKIAFSNYEMASADDSTQASGQRTEMLDISSLTLTQPCFYADAGEESVYAAGQRRGGYWAELGSVFDEAEETLDYAADYAGTEESLWNESTKYVKTTFFDYYSDLELDRLDRRVQGADNQPGTGRPGYDYTNRTYAPNRIFNMVLSDYYKSNGVESPSYFGHFQWETNSEGTYFNTIAPDLNLYSYDGNQSNSKFLYTNNSDYRENAQKGDADVATQGLIYDKLDSNGNLQVKEGVVAPYFDKDFVTGNNTYNVAVGKVYEDVTFPFTKNNEDYWVFNSKDTTLRMTKDSESHYFMRNVGTGNEVKGYTNGAPTASGNFFPFNDHAQSGVINKLDYGFGMKMDIDFSLTSNGKIGSTPIIFSFSGDDDIWIFIDGNLVLDMGGSHGEVDGNLNFATKTAHVSKIKTPTGASIATGDIDKNFAEAIDDSKELHTLTIFYMERGLWESNMSISFNFPEMNLFKVDKKVDTTNVNEAITENTKVASNLNQLEFDFGISNLVTAGGARTVEEMNTYLATIGFDIDHTRLSDYGSYAVSNAQFKPVTGATYSVGDTSKTVAAGAITLKNNEQAEFTNMFRRGSYLSVTEQSGVMLKTLSGDSSFDITDLFDTTWKINGYDDNEKNNGTGITPKDERSAETFDTVTNGIADGYLDGKDTILYRNYVNGKSKVTPVDIGVSYTNRFKTGSIIIKKEQAAGSELSASQEYTFTVTLNNIAGLHLEETINADYSHTDNQTISLGTYTLKKGEQKVITGIPLGTEYTIVEAVPTDSSSLASVTGGTTVTLGERKVTGVVKTADADNTLTFYNTIPAYKVVYFTEIAETDYVADANHKKVQVGEKAGVAVYKYFVKADDALAATYTASAKAGSIISYDSAARADLSGGIKLKKPAGEEASVAATYKTITGYQYNPVTTQKAGQYTDTVAADKVAEVDLFYELTSYKEKYYVEADDQTATVTPGDDTYIQIGEVIYEKDSATETTKELQLINASKTVTDLSATTYQAYTLLTMTGENATKYPATANIAADGSTVLYQIYAKAGYGVEYFVEVEKEDYDNAQAGTVKDNVGGKYFVRKEYVIKTGDGGKTYEYDYITSGTDQGKAGAKQGATKIDDTYKSYVNYEFNDATTKNAHNGTTKSVVAATGTPPMIKLYYEKIPADYEVNYYVEINQSEYDSASASQKAAIKVVSDAQDSNMKYFKFETKLNESGNVGDTIAVPNGASPQVNLKKFDQAATAKVAGTDKAFTNYQYSKDYTVYAGSNMATLTNDETVHVDLYYVKIPTTYTVKHYVEVEESEYNTLSGQGKDVRTQSGRFFKLQDSIAEQPAYVGDTLSYATGTAVATQNKAGVSLTTFDTAKKTENTATFKSYAAQYYQYNKTITDSDTANSTAVVQDKAQNEVRLYHEKLRNRYTERYYTESDDQTSPVTPDGKTRIKIGDIIYEWKVDYPVDVPKESDTATVTDRKEDYPGYQPIDDQTPAYPKTDTVEEDGSTIVYQILGKAKYRVEYYLEVDETTYHTEMTGGSTVKAVAGKYFVLDADNTRLGLGSSGDALTYDYKTATSGVTEAGAKLKGVEIAETYQSYADRYYQFNNTTTNTNGLTSATLKSGSEAVIQLFYEKIPADYIVNYYVEIDEAAYQLKNSKGEPVSKVTLADNTNRCFVKEASVGPTTENAGDEVAYTTSGIGSATKAGVTLKKYGKTEAVTVEATLKAFSNYIYSDDVTKAATDNKAAITLKEGDTVHADLYYVKQPAIYLVEYWLETDQATYDATTDDTVKRKVSGKYFIKHTESYSGTANAGDVIEYASRVSATTNETEAGVTLEAFDKEKTGLPKTIVADSYKAFANYVYKADTTKSAGDYQATVKAGTTAPAVVRLFYEKIPASYTEEYYIETDEDEGTDTIEIGGKIYKKQESNTINDQVAGTPVEVTDKHDKAPYDSYVLIEGVSEYPPTGIVKKDGSTVVYQIYGKNPAKYTVEYYVQVDRAVYDNTAEEDRSEADGKYFVRKTGDTVVNSANVGDKIRYTTKEDKAGIELTTFDTDKTLTADNTLKSYDDYTFSVTSTQAAQKYEDTVVKGDTALVKLYFEKLKASYTEKYYIEVDKKGDTENPDDYIEDGGKIYKKNDSRVVTNTEVGKNVTIVDKQTEEPYNKFKLVTITGYPDTEVVAKDNSTVVYQIYAKNPANYTVEYYLETDQTSYDNASGTDRDMINDKYFVKRDFITKSANVSDVVTYSKLSEVEAGVTIRAADKDNEAKVLDSFKSYETENYQFDLTSTRAAEHYSTIVNKEGTAFVRLYYDKVKVPYTEKYYIQVESKETTGDYIEKDGKLYKLEDSNTVDDQEVGRKVTVTDKQTEQPYVDYKLTTVEGYPVTDNVRKDGQTVVYQIYEMVPTYTVEYYTETDKETYDKKTANDRNIVNGKYFIKASEDVVNKAAIGNAVKYAAADTKTAGVTLNGIAVDGNAIAGTVTNNTYQSFVGYEFSEEDTKSAAKAEITVKFRDNLVQLYYVKPVVPVVTADYTVRYYKQVSEGAYQKAAENDRVKVGDKFFIKAAEPVVNRAEENDKIKYNMTDAETAGVTRNNIKVTGEGVNDTYQSFDGYVFDESVTVAQGYSEASVKADGSSVIDLYYVKATAAYEVEYWLQVDKDTYDSASGAKNTINGKYFVREDKETVEGMANVGDVITCSTRKNTSDVTEAGITLTQADTDDSVAVDNTFKAFEEYDFKLSTTVAANKVTDTVNEETKAVVRLYYEKQLTYYTEEYYLEVFEQEDTGEYITVPTDKGTKIYRKNESNVVKDQELGKKVTITDKQQEEPYTNYKLIQITGYPDTDTVLKDGSTIVYQIYERKPVYTVEYYVEVDEGTYNKTDENERDKVDDKYFIKKEMVVKTAEVNDEIKYDYTDDDSDDKTKAGITITGNDGTKTVDDTYRSYENYEFKPGTTEDARSYEDTINLDKNAKVKLYYESVITLYTEKYYIQLDDEEAKDVTVDGENYIELTINGKTKIFKKQEQEQVDNQKAGWTADVESKEGEGVYSDYELVKTTVDGYPATDTIMQDGSTVVYQIYVRKAIPEEPVTSEPTTPEEPTTSEPIVPEEPVTAVIVAPEEPTTVVIAAPETTQPTTTKRTTSTVKTGDSVNSMILLMIFLSASIVTAVVLNRKKEQEP